MEGQKAWVCACVRRENLWPCFSNLDFREVTVFNGKKKKRTLWKSLYSCINQSLYMLKCSSYSANVFFFLNQ